MKQTSGNYFEAKIRREGTTEDGMTAKLNEVYVVRADSFTECEARITSFVSQFSQGEFDVLTETKAKYNEIFFSDGEDDLVYYKVRVSFIVVDDSGKVKKNRVDYLVQGSSIDSAKKNIDDVLASSMTDYRIQSVSETSISDIVDAQL